MKGKGGMNAGTQPLRFHKCINMLTHISTSVKSLADVQCFGESVRSEQSFNEHRILYF